MAIGFVIFWVAVGLGVFFVAMRGGPRGARGPIHTESKASRRAVVVVVVVLMSFGIIVPTLVLAFNGAHKASVAPGGLMLTAQQQHGRELFARACATCHTLSAARAVGRVGPNLDVLVPTYGNKQAREALVLNAIANGRARGMGQMPAMLYQGQDAQAVADFVSTVVGR